MGQGVTLSMAIEASISLRCELIIGGWIILKLEVNYPPEEFVQREFREFNV